MTYYSNDKEFYSFRIDINDIRNVTCDLCNNAFMTTLNIITYCDSYIEELERNTPDE